MSDSQLDPAPTSSEQEASYVVVARRYRPRNFEELVGQEHVGRALTNAIETGRVGHAYLFTGARGVGKTSTARIFAKALNNPDGPSAAFDNTSDIAQAIDSGEDIDVIEIDGASNRGIDEIRSLRANIGVRPSRSRYKVYIIDEVHMLTQAAFNALLKTLEEPPEHVKFIFCTTDPEKLPITVLSRCQRFDFAPVEVPKIVARLRDIVTAEKAQADDAALELIARRAAGSMRDSQSLLEQVLSFSDGQLTADQVHAMLGTADDERLHRLAAAMCQRDAAEAIAQLDTAIDAGVDAGRFAEQLLGYFRDLMAVTVGCDASLQRHTAASMHDELKQLGQSWGLQTVLAVVGLIDQTLVRIRHSVYGRVLLESTVIQICHLPDLQAVADLAAAAGQDASGPAQATSGGEKKKQIAEPRGTLNAGAEAGRPVRQATAVSPPAATGDSAAADQGPEGGAAAPTPARDHGGADQRDADHGKADQGKGPGDRRADGRAAKTASAPAPQAAEDQGPTSQGPTSQGPTSQGPTSQAPTAQGPTSQGPTSQAPSVQSSTAQATASPPSPQPSGSGPGAGAPQPRGALSASTLPEIFRAALADIPRVTATMASLADVKLEDDSTVRLVFPAQSTMSMRRMDLPEHRGELIKALTARAGAPVTLKLAVAPQTAANAAPVKAAPKQTAKERMERMRQIESHPWVQACVETFGAEIVKVDAKR